MTQDLVYKFSQFVLIENTGLVDVFRILSAVFSWLTAVLLLKLYKDKNVGKMNKAAALGAVMTYFTVGYAQIIAFSAPFSPRALTVLNLLVFISVFISFIGASKSMHITLFRKNMQ